MKKDFIPYKVGTIFNPIKKNKKKLVPLYKSIKIKFPSRLNAMAVDPSKIVSNNNLVYTPGEVVFSIGIYKTIKVSLLDESLDTLIISPKSKRRSLIRHSYLLMKKALGFKCGMFIEVNNSKEYKHCGLGSSGALIAGVACVINEIFGNPIRGDILVKYLAQNHGEEIEGEENLINPVQCIGGSAASGIFEGGLLVLAGQSCLIKTMNIPSQYKVIIGIPKDFIEEDSVIMLEKELNSIRKFLKCGERFGPRIAYNMFHKFLPAMCQNELKTIGDVIFDYRFNMGSIENCSFAYPNIVKLTKKLIFLKKDGIVDVLAISSVGPGVFAITTNPKVCVDSFESNGLRVITSNISNDKYIIVKKINA
jgi:predicted sugar kinase